MKTIYPDKWNWPKKDEDDFGLPRHIEEVFCKCGGLAKRVESTTEEIKDNRFNCGRNYSCCCRAFVCEKCDMRLVGRADAPEPE